MAVGSLSSLCEPRKRTARSRMPTRHRSREGAISSTDGGTLNVIKRPLTFPVHTGHLAARVDITARAWRLAAPPLASPAVGGLDVVP